MQDSPDAVPAKDTPAITFRGVSQVFERPGSSSPLIAVQDIELEIRRGQFVAVVGPSGCGKSTLLGLVAGLLEPVAGRVEVEGEPVTGIRTDVGFVLQKDALLPWRTALENVALGLKYRGNGW